MEVICLTKALRLDVATQFVERATCSLVDRLCVDGSVAERSKALVLGTSHFDGVGSNPTTASNLFFFFFFL